MMAEAGAKNVEKDPKMANEAMAGLKNVFGDLFNKKELMRAAVLMVGARLTGATPGQALAIAGQQYLNRIDAQAARNDKLLNDLIKNGTYPTDLIPATAQRIGTGEFKEFYSPTGQRVNAQKFKVGEGQYVWVGEDGKQINSKYNSDPARCLLYTSDAADE